MTSSRTLMKLTAAAAAGGGIVLCYYLHQTRRERHLNALKHSLGVALNDQIEMKRPKCHVTVVSTLAEWKAIENKLTGTLNSVPVMGFDMEWVTPRGGGSPRKGSLMQLGLYNGWCVLIRTHLLEELPQSLKDILSDSEIVKIGVGVFDDARKLKTDTGVPLRGALDLRHYVDLYRPLIKKRGLAGLANAFLGVEMDKDWRVRASDWEAEVLTKRQIEYAANDALIAMNILLQITIESLDATTQVANIRDLAKASYTVAKKHFGVPYKQSRKPRDAASPSNGNILVNANNGRPLKDPTNKMSTRKSKLYHNAKLQAPDGQPLCTCDIAKANWYVAKGLGEIVNTGEGDDAFTVRLTFEPSGRPEGPAGDYYLTVKENVCVVCGKNESYLRKYVVPREYRTHFPEVMREHQSHDVLLMCVKCHQVSNLHDLTLRRALSDECGAPIGTESDVKCKEDFELKQVKSAARAIMKNRSNGGIPEDRVKELEKILRSYYQVPDDEEISKEVLMRGANADTNIYNDWHQPHGKLVVEMYEKTGGILRLEKRWREHFLETMKPKFLPSLWSVDHQQERLETRAAENRIDQKDYDVAKGLDSKETS